MRRIYYLTIIISVTLISFFAGIKAGAVFPPEAIFDGNSSRNEESIAEEPNPEEPLKSLKPDLRTVKLVAVGNVFPHEPQIKQARLEDGTYDFSPSFEIIAPLLQASDIALTDLETSQAGPDLRFLGVSGYTGFPLFNSPRELSIALNNAGINLFNLANNHALDRGYEGMLLTIDFLRSLGVYTTGAFRSFEERERPMIVEINGIKIAFIGYTYSTNGITVPAGHEYIVNLSPNFDDITPIINDIEAARQEGASLVVVIPHWGEEHAHEPSPQALRDKAAELAAAGADLIIGGHPKYIQPLEWFFNTGPDNRERATLVIYSRGNFFCNQREGDGYNSIYNEFGLLADIAITKNMDTGDVWISNVNYEVTWIHHDWRHRVIPVSKSLEGPVEAYNLNETQINRLAGMFDYFAEHIEKYRFSEGLTRAMKISESLFIRAYQ